MGFIKVGGGVYIPAAPPSDFPLSISADSKSLKHADGSAFLANGEAPWSLATNCSSSDVTTYLNDAQSRNINFIMLELIEHSFTDQSPHWVNKNGDNAFTSTISAGNPDFTTPNEPYWVFVDSVISAAASRGIVVMAFPAYLGFAQGTEGWASVVSANGTTRMTTYGQFIGNRYKNQPNIIWAMGGDTVPNTPTDLTVHVNNLANGIKGVDSNHLMTAHPAPGTISTDSYNQPWLDFIAAYPSSNTDLNARVRIGYQATPTKPVIMIEGSYGNEHLMTDILLRIQMYQSILGCGIGHVYGQDPLWYFGVDASASGASFADTPGLDWHTQLNNFGRSYLIYVQRLQAARPLATLTPDYSHAAVTAGFGTDGTTYAPVMFNSQILVAYTNGVALTVAKSQFTATTFNINWYNVRAGTTTNGGTVAMGSGSQVFTPPTTGGGNDWVLLLDDASLSLTNP